MLVGFGASISKHAHIRSRSSLHKIDGLESFDLERRPEEGHVAADNFQTKMTASSRIRPNIGHVFVE